jgi:hypothetical protein
MPQLLLQGFPMGPARIGSSLSVLEKEGTRTYFNGDRSVLPQRFAVKNHFPYYP